MFFGSQDAYFYSELITTLIALGYIVWMVLKEELFGMINQKLEILFTLDNMQTVEILQFQLEY